jgi:hypothetical protein
MLTSPAANADAARLANQVSLIRARYADVFSAKDVRDA